MATTPEVYTQAVILMAGAVVAAPIFKRIGLGTILGYLAAGVVLGPVIGVVQNGESILHFAELGIVFLLFIVGLEMNPSRLWSMRRDIFGMGTAQVLVCGFVLSLAGWLVLPDFRIALVAGFGLALSSTAFALQMLESRKEMNTSHGRKTFAILLFQDLAIIPLLAILPLLSFYVDTGSDWRAFIIGVGAIAFVIFAGQYLLNPLLGIIARTGAHEAMIATALLVVFGSAMLMEAAGLSMALGSFLAGVLLAESSYKHELEANIEPFRGILLGLFFMAVGLSLDISVLLENWLAILACVLAAMAVKSACIFGIVKMFGSSNANSIRVASMLSQHGEFGFVLFASAGAIGILNTQTSSFLVAMVVLSMALTPMCVWLGNEIIDRTEEPEDDPEEDFEGANSPVLMIGFSRMGQIAAQTLLASGTDVTVIDNNPNIIRQAARFGFRIYFGNGMRKEVLLSAGIANCSIVCVSTHNPEITNRIVDLIAGEFPDKPIYVRAYDRAHTLQLMDRQVKFHIRETFESALVFGAEMLVGLGYTHEQAEEIVEEVRYLDNERIKVQYRKGIFAGQDMMPARQPVQPEPLVDPQHPAEALDERSREVVEEADDQDKTPAE